MTDTSPTHTVRSWLGIPYATAERFRRPTSCHSTPTCLTTRKVPHRSNPGTPAGSKPTTDSARTA